MLIDSFIQKRSCSMWQQLEHAGPRFRRWTLATPWWQSHTICHYNYPSHCRSRNRLVSRSQVHKVKVRLALCRALSLFIPSPAWRSHIWFPVYDTANHARDWLFLLFVFTEAWQHLKEGLTNSPLPESVAKDFGHRPCCHTCGNCSNHRGTWADLKRKDYCPLKIEDCG